MSNLTQITESRSLQRTVDEPEIRAVRAAEDSADALEGIRQDLTMISGQLTHVVQALTRLAQRQI